MREDFDDWLSSADEHTLALELNRAPAEDRVRAFQRLSPGEAFRLFRRLEPVNQADILASLDEKSLGPLLEEMEPDDRARLFAMLPKVEVERFRKKLSPSERESTDLLLEYPKHSAGRIMSPEFVSLAADMTAAEALETVRANSERAETVSFLPAVNNDMTLRGVVWLEDLALADPSVTVGSLIQEVPAAHVDDDQEDVARFVKSTDLFALPVLDADQRLVGIITFDDAMEVLEFEEGEDLARTGAAEPIARPYLAVSVLRLVRSRLVWLSVLALAATLTVNVLSVFEDTLSQVVTLALFIPLLIGIGGNTGAQSATTIVRALAVQDVHPRDVLRVAYRETQTGLVLGGVIGAVALAGVSVLFDRDIGVVVAITLVAICALAALVGSVMPIIARVFGIDPAVFSAPVVTTVVDASGLLVYFLVARLVLGL